MLRAEQMPDAFQRACVILKLIMSLCVSRQLLAHFKSVTIALQGVGVDIVSGFSMIKTVKDTLQM